MLGKTGLALRVQVSLLTDCQNIRISIKAKMELLTISEKVKERLKLMKTFGENLFGFVAALIPYPSRSCFENSVVGPILFRSNFCLRF